MKLELVPNWRRVLKRSWSVWCAVLASLLASAEVFHGELVQILPVLQPLLPPKLAGYFGLALTVAIPVVRIIRQAKLAVEQADAGHKSDRA